MPARAPNSGWATLFEDGEPSEFVDINPSGLFSDHLCERSVEEFGSDGAWFLLSILSSGWRTYFDLAVAIGDAPDPVKDEARPTPVHHEFQIAKDLQVQSFLYSAAELFAGLVRAARAHKPGTSSFFDTYVEHKNVGALIEAISDLGRDELDELIGVPRDASDLVASTRRDASGPTLLGLKEIEVVDIGGLFVPRSVLHDGARRNLFDHAQELADLILTNIRQLGSLVEVPAAGDGVPSPQPLREVDNAFRHGHRVLLHSAIPEPRTFRSVAKSGAIDTHAVDLYLPKGKDSIRFATVFCSPARTAEHLEALRQISLRTGQFVRGFVGWKALGSRGLFASAVWLNLEPAAGDSSASESSGT